MSTDETLATVVDFAERAARAQRAVDELGAGADPIGAAVQFGAFELAGRCAVVVRALMGERARRGVSSEKGPVAVLYALAANAGRWVAVETLAEWVGYVTVPGLTRSPGPLEHLEALELAQWDRRTGNARLHPRLVEVARDS